jgi:hypothetical protein
MVKDDIEMRRPLPKMKFNKVEQEIELERMLQ